MNTNSIIDYLSCILFRALAFVVRFLPVSLSLFLARRLGDLLYYFDLKHRARAYSNIKLALGSKLSISQLNKATHEFYQSFVQNLIEILFIPFINRRYVDKYVSFEGLHYIDEAFKKKKGVILLGVHAGSWELSSIICASLGFPFSLFVRNQRYPKLERLLNQYRLQKGCKIIQRQNQVRQLIQALKNNEALGMTADQGGKTGVIVKFFGREASMPTGAVRLALKYDSVILTTFHTRIKGPYIKTIIEPAFNLQRTGNLEKDIHDNVQAITHIFERYIEKYPKDYLWTYKIWKYGKDRNVLILSDGKAGHLRQAQAVANIVEGCLAERGMKAKIDNIEVKFKNHFAKQAFMFGSLLSGKYRCQGCLGCMRRLMETETYDSLIRCNPDIIISCGSSLAGVNFLLAKENLAKSIVITKPSVLSTKRFDLVIMPKHDLGPKKNNIVETEGALNLVNDGYLREQSQRLVQNSRLQTQDSKLNIGLLIGGDTKGFCLRRDNVLEVVNQIKSSCAKLDAHILATTSRRTSLEIQDLLKGKFNDYPRCSLLVLANEKNIPEAMGGILGLSQIVIVSPESISMISEAINSRKYVIIFDLDNLNGKHRRFLDNAAKNKYIYLAKRNNLSKVIEDIWLNKPAVSELKDNILVKEAISKIL